jgi:hypothetical protein
MLYRDLRLLILSFVEHKTFGPIKTCFLIRRVAELSFDERGLAARIKELDSIFKRAEIPNDVSVRSAANHALCMDEIFEHAQAD